MLLRIDLDPANVSLTGFASNMTGAGPWTMTADNSGDGLAHQVSIRNDSANNHAGKTVTLVGTDADGNAQTEVVTGPGGSATVESTKYFLTLTTATPSATIGTDTFDFGWVDEFVSESFPLQYERNVSSKFILDVTGTINLDVQFTVCDTTDRAHFADQEAYKWVEPAASLTAETSDSTAIVEVGAGYTAFRVQVNSYTDTAELQLYVSQPSE